ncbi:MAG: hypothetical protein HXY22_03975 [Alphaproteobacteria bacterium]|nr:hypothetical protein [Alphaproteobacteria bacterium]
MRNSLIGASVLAGVAACFLVAMLTLAVMSGGVTQQKFETLSPITAYTLALANAKPAMSATLALDNLFIILYVASLAIGLSALGGPATRAATVLSVAGMVGVGLFDFAENLHFVTMYAQLDAGMAIAPDQVARQMWASLLKWHIAYFALFMASFVIAERGAGLLGAILVWSLRLVLPVVGVLSYSAPDALQPLFFLARYGLMLSGFLLFAWVFAASAGATKGGAGA